LYRTISSIVSGKHKIDENNLQNSYNTHIQQVKPEKRYFNLSGVKVAKVKTNIQINVKFHNSDIYFETTLAKKTTLNLR